MWYQFCENPRSITEIFGNEPVGNPVEIHSVRLHQDGPLIQLQIELPTFPEKQQPRWPIGANTLQVELDLWGVTSFEQVGWGTSNIGVLSLEREDALKFTFVSNHSKFSGSCIVARIGKVSAYINGSKEKV
ncbi:Imm50 family immunity protein [Geotalea daltonii]|uniref:Imm50 family immunity protein n=1 Tax=Geotalea daltonii TaxID=1203471 RepID=UPI00059C46F9|nr:Imm50 family immunity protein [Geotalea daltonii]